METLEGGRPAGANGDAEDGTLLARAARGDARAFEAFVRRWEAPLHRFLRRVLGSADLADEARQQALVRVYVSAAEFRGGSARAWLFRTAYRAALNLLRDEARRTVPSLENPDILPGLAPEPPALASAAEEREALRRALEELETSDRALLWLRVGEGMSLAEAAAVLGAPASTLRYRLYRALRRARRRLAAPARPGGPDALP